MEGARGVLFTITGSDYTLFEVNEAASIIQGAADPDANIIFGAVLASALPADKVAVSLRGVRDLVL